MKFKEFLTEAPMMGNDRITKDKVDPQKWLNAIRDEVKKRIDSGIDLEDGIPDDPDGILYNFKKISSEDVNGYTLDEYSKYEYGNVISVSKGGELFIVVKYDKYEKKYFQIEVISKTKSTPSDKVVEIILMLTKHKKRIGMKSDRIQTSGGRNMWKNIIANADKNGYEYGYFKRSAKTKWDGGLSDFYKFADDELYDSLDNPNRAKFSYSLYFEF